MQRFLCLIALSGLYLSGIGQSLLCLSTDKTTSLIFPFPITHVDRGTPVVLAQQVKDVPNLLLVKAGAKDFGETNLSVATDDGSLYAFTICYDKNPSTWVYRLPIQSKGSLESYANAILDNPKTASGIQDRKWEMRLGVQGIYVKNNTLFFQMNLENRSPLDYDIELVRLFIGDRTKSKRTAVQELDLQPLQVSGNVTTIKSSAGSVFVVAVQKFTIPEAKFLGIEVKEKGGGRHLFVKVGNRKLMHAIPLPDLK